MHDSSTCPLCRSRPIGGSMSDAEFFAFLSACRAELADKQPRFEKRIAAAKTWHYDLDDSSLRIGDGVFPITPIGSHSPERQTWLWAWANEDYPAVARIASERLQALYQITGFRVFIDPGIPASPADAQDFTALAVHQLDALGFFRSPSDGPTLYLAVHQPAFSP